MNPTTTKSPDRSGTGATTTTTTTTAKPPEHRKKNPWLQSLAALPWLTPTLLLIIGVVIYPTFLLVYYSFIKFNKYGVDKGFTGFDNYVGKAGALT